MYPILLKEIKKIKQQPLISFIYIERENTKFTMCVNKSGLEILFLCNGKNSLNDIKSILSQKYNEKYDIVSKFVDDFLNYSVKMNNVALNAEPLNNDINIKYIGVKDFWTPDLISIELTHRCPLKCKHCFLDAGVGEMMDDILLKHICQEAVELGVDSIQLTGGEPLLHPQLFNTIDYLLHNNIEVFLFTSGFLCDNSILDEFRRYIGKNIKVQISLDGLEEYHNNFRGNKNSFNNAIKFIKFLTDNNITTIIGTCIVEQSLDEMEELCLLVKNLGVKTLRLSATSERGRAVNNNILSSNSKVISVRKIKKILGQKYNSENFNVEYHEENEIKLNIKYIKNCGMGQTMLKIDPKGDVYPCLMSDICVGNLTNKSIKNILESYSVIFSKIERPNNDYCGDCSFNEMCSNCIVEALLYSKKIDNCKWYESQKTILNKILL